MLPGPRAIKLADVANGRITPEEAEKWARDQGLEPFARKPDVPADEIMALEKWTAPMAAAWFIWRSPDAVRDQWDKARQGWTIWERLPGRRMPNSRGRWRLERVGPATLADVFSQAGFAKQIARSSPVGHSDALGANSIYGQSVRPHETRTGTRMAAGNPRATGDEARRRGGYSPGHWKALFRQLTNIQRIPASSGAAGSKAVQRRSSPEEGEILFSREQVIDAEARISREEFEWRIWTIAQSFGWLAYGTESKFRSLEELRTCAEEHITDRNIIPISSQIIWK